MSFIHPFAMPLFGTSLGLIQMWSDACGADIRWWKQLGILCDQYSLITEAGMKYLV